MIEAVVIDVGWFLSVSDEAIWDDNRAARDFLNAVIDREIPYVIDAEGKIIAEYSRYLQATPLGLGFTKKMGSLQLVAVVSGKREQKCEKCLDRIGFDPSDRPYVGAAQRSGGVYLTDEAKHLDPEQATRIYNCCGVRVIGTKDLPGIFT